MNYLNFTTNDFLEDLYFRQWIQNPDEESNLFWGEFQKKNPQLIEPFNNACKLLRAIHQQVETTQPSQQRENESFEWIINELNADKSSNFIIPIWVRWAVAASVVLMSSLWVYWQPKNEVILSYETLKNKETIKLTERVNNSDGVQQVKLSDGSIIHLQPNSKVSFPTQFNSGFNRQVFLSGEAFFEVTKNPSKPFIVYANELVTKVIGTSFIIKAFPNDKEVSVNVKTGKVSVSVAKQAINQQMVSKRELEGIVLLPNQKAVLSRQEVRLIKSLIENPMIISAETANHKPSRSSFVYDSTPASAVFKTIEVAYGVDIVFDEELFSTCEFSGNLNEESLYEKLEIICKSIEAKYQILDAQIIISGKGCK